MLRWRLILGTTFIALLIGLFWLDSRAPIAGLWLLPLAILLAVVATEELLSLFAARGYRPVGAAVYVGNVAIVASNYIEVWEPRAVGPLGWPMIAFALCIVIAFAAEMSRYRGPRTVLEPLSLTTFAFAYLGVLLSFVVQLRLLGPGGSQGIVALASLLIVTKLSDIGAYTVGRLVGRHKLAPLLSPGKTIEGTIGGLLFAQLGAWFCGAFLVPELAGPSGGNRGGWAIFGLAVGFFAIAGDLAESLLKRDAQRKDSSTWMPGFGGILDILDSILVAAPAAYLCWLIGLVGP